MTERELDRALADLGAAVEYPATPALAEAVATRLEERPVLERTAPAGRPRWRRPRTGWRRLAVAGLAVLLVAVAVLVASPQTREAVARRLGLRGVSVQLGGPAPTTVTTRPGDRLDLRLGERVGLAEARRRVAFPLLVPTAPGFQRPDAVYVGQRPEGGRVDLVYRARSGLPASSFTDAGLLITEFRAELVPDFIKKMVGAGQVQAVAVGGEPGYWFSGAPHFFSYRGRDGDLREEQSRLAGNTLVWQRGDLTLRLEGQLSKEAALRIAESMR